MSAETEELRRLITLLEHSGLAARRPDVAALIEASRSRLAGGGMPPRRPRGRARAKAGALLLLLADALMLGAAVSSLVALVLAPSKWLPALLLAAAAIWGLVRSAGARAVIGGSGFWLRYHLRWGWLWLAEAFSPAAQTRLDALLYGREVMQAWRRHRRQLPHAPGIADLEGFLHQTYGPQAVARFHDTAQGQAWSLRGGAGPRAPSLRRSYLLPRFELLAMSGALWPEPEPEPVGVPAAPPPPPFVAQPPDPPEMVQRRTDLRALIKRKREDINAAHGWKLKTPAEIAQRDAHLNALRDEVRLLEAELVALG